MSEHEPPRPGAATAPIQPDDARVIRMLFHRVSATGGQMRTAYATMMSALRRECFAAIAEAPSAEATRLANELATVGMIDLGELLDPRQVADMVGFLKPRRLYAGHVSVHSDGVARDFDALRASVHYGAYGPEDLARCPHVIEIANDPRLLQIAEAYLGCPPTLYGINAWWSFPRGSASPIAQSLHRDIEDLRFLTLFIYLTPVGDANGPHRYIKHTHDQAALTRMLRGRGWPAETVDAQVPPMFHGEVYNANPTADAMLDPLAMVWRGAAGSALMADTYGLHMGVPVQQGERLMLWIRYGIGHSWACFSRGHGALIRPRLADTDRARYINRLLLAD